MWPRPISYSRMCSFLHLLYVSWVYLKLHECFRNHSSIPIKAAKRKELIAQSVEYYKLALSLLEFSQHDVFSLKVVLQTELADVYLSVRLLIKELSSLEVLRVAPVTPERVGETWEPLATKAVESRISKKTRIIKELSSLEPLATKAGESRISKETRALIRESCLLANTMPVPKELVLSITSFLYHVQLHQYSLASSLYYTVYKTCISRQQHIDIGDFHRVARQLCLCQDAFLAVRIFSQAPPRAISAC